jgi:hypothetical protein
MLLILATYGKKNVKQVQEQTCTRSVMSRVTVPKLPISHGAFPRKSCLPWHKRMQLDDDHQHHVTQRQCIKITSGSN